MSNMTLSSSTPATPLHHTTSVWGKMSNISPQHPALSKFEKFLLVEIAASMVKASQGCAFSSQIVGRLGVVGALCAAFSEAILILDSDSCPALFVPTLACL